MIASDLLEMPPRLRHQRRAGLQAIPESDITPRRIGAR